jgi:farnesyl diphosphate synthase
MPQEQMRVSNKMFAVPPHRLQIVGQGSFHWSITAMATKTTRADFTDVFPSLVEDLLGECRKFNLPDNALQWFEKVPVIRKLCICPLG